MRPDGEFSVAVEVVTTTAETTAVPSRPDGTLLGTFGGGTPEASRQRPPTENKMPTVSVSGAAFDHTEKMSS